MRIIDQSELRRKFQLKRKLSTQEKILTSRENYQLRTKVLVKGK